jgi:AraC-like DNA-binding protein
MNYVKHLRMEQASRRLLLSEVTVKEISEQCGFANPYHFSREFKAANGQSPAFYRRQNRGMQV